MNEKILLMNDLPGYGTVALSAMAPILSHAGMQVFQLPTAVISNTLDYGKYGILDTTDYMQRALTVWQELGFRFDAISTGFMLGNQQARFVADFCKTQSAKGVKIFCDPIMADNGKLYNGMTEETVRSMRHLASCADYIFPNFTEAMLLIGDDPKKEPAASEIPGIIHGLRELGAKSVVITSVSTDGASQVCGYDAIHEAYFSVPYQQIPARLPGTGDIFSAIVLSQVMQGASLERSVQKAVDALEKMIRRSLDTQHIYKGIAIHACLDLL